MPLRAVVNKDRTWQRMFETCEVAGKPVRQEYWQASWIVPALLSKPYVLSIETKDLYYSLQKVELYKLVRSALDFDLAHFQSTASDSIEDCLTLLGSYPETTVINIDECLYTQCNSMCIGSIIAPLLVEIYLNVLKQWRVGFPSFDEHWWHFGCTVR